MSRCDRDRVAVMKAGDHVRVHTNGQYRGIGSGARFVEIRHFGHRWVKIAPSHEPKQYATEITRSDFDRMLDEVTA